MTLRRLLVTAALLLVVAGLLWAGAGTSGAWKRAAALPPSVWLLALAGLLTSYGLRAARLHAEWRGRALLEPLACLRVTLMHIAAVNVLPMRAGELGYPWLLRRHGRIALADAVSSLVWMRAQDATVLSWLGLLAVVAVLHGQGLLSSTLALLAVTAATALFLTVVARLGPWSQAWFGRWQRARWLARLRPVLLAVQQASQRARPETWLWCLANWLVKLATVAGLLAALAAVPLLQSWCGALGGELGAALPVQPPAGFGTYEAGSALAATLSGPGNWTDLLGAALAVHLFGIVTAALAGSLASFCLAGTLPPAPIESAP